jgi:hypothetical protein
VVVAWVLRPAVDTILVGLPRHGAKRLRVGSDRRAGNCSAHPWASARRIPVRVLHSRRRRRCRVFTPERDPTRTRGVVYELSVTGHAISWNGYNQRGSALTDANRVRGWLHSSQLGLPLPINAHEQRTIRAYASAEDEFLLIGDVAARELRAFATARCLKCRFTFRAPLAALRQRVRCPRCRTLA